jgi:hypothetical protein
MMSATILLVPGAWSGRWIWGPVERELEARGVAHQSVDHPSVGAERHRLAGMGPDELVHLLGRLLERDLQLDLDVHQQQAVVADRDARIELRRGGTFDVGEQRLSRIRDHRREVHEPLHLRVTHRRTADDGAPVGIAHKDDRAPDLVDDGPDVGGVVVHVLARRVTSD